MIPTTNLHQMMHQNLQMLWLLNISLTNSLPTHFTQLLHISTAERPFVDVLQDRRYWLIHLITIPSLFLAGILFMLSGFVFKLFGVVNLTSYLDNDDSALSFSLINDRFCVKNSTNDI